MKEQSVAQLRPDFPYDPRTDRMKFSPRYLGSAHLNLKRPSRMPASSRRYIYGDPVQMIDWRAYARTDQLIIREQRDEAWNRVLICVDYSDSMHWPEPTERLPTKLEIALRIGFHLAFAHHKKGDLVDFQLWRSGESMPGHSLLMRSSSDTSNLFQLLEDRSFAIEQIMVDKPRSLATVDHYDLGYFIGDGLDHSVFEALQKETRSLHMVHVLSQRESDISWMRDEVCYFDESGRKKEFLGSVLKHDDTYLSTIRQWKDELRRLCLEKNGSYMFVTDLTSLNEYVSLVSSLS